MCPKGMLSEERVDDTSGDESSTPEPAQTLKQKLNGTAKSSSPTREEQVSESDNAGSASESDVSSSSASSNSASSTRSKRKSYPMGSATVESPSKRQKFSYDKIKRIEPTAYVPPQGYSAIRIKASDIAALGMFDTLEGKQIWHISAPSTMPISQIESLDVANGLKGVEILNHQGVAYELSPANVEGATVLLPQGRTGEYASASAKVTRAFSIQESWKATENGHISASESHDPEADRTVNFFAMQTGQKPPPRKQPSNLKARYVPYGVSAEKEDVPTSHSTVQDEDVIMVDASADTAVEPETASQRTPKTSTKTKHKKPPTDDSAIGETPSKKKKGPQGSPSPDTPMTLDGSSKTTRKKEKSSKSAV